MMSLLEAGDGTPHTGAMIALVPSGDDIARLALDGGEPASDLHLTLFFLGLAASWDPDERDELTAAVRTVFPGQGIGPVKAEAFGVAHWNPHGDEPVWVWQIGGTPDLVRVQEAAALSVDYAAQGDLTDSSGVPEQHVPWIPHVTGIYSTEDWRIPMEERTGPVLFDRVRVSFGGQYTDIPL